MTENKKKTYVSPSMKVYEIKPTQLLAGNPGDTQLKTSVNEWNEGGDFGNYDID